MCAGAKSGRCESARKSQTQTLICHYYWCLLLLCAGTAGTAVGCGAAARVAAAAAAAVPERTDSSSDTSTFPLSVLFSLSVPGHALHLSPENQSLYILYVRIDDRSHVKCQRNDHTYTTYRRDTMRLQLRIATYQGIV